MTTVLSLANRTFLLRHPWQLVLALLGITLGVAVVVAIELALESSLQSFEQAGKAVSGAASHRIIASDGGLNENIYTKLRVEHGIRELSPIIQMQVTVPVQPDDNFKLVGIDPFIEKSFQSSWQNAVDSSQSRNAIELVSKPQSALLSVKMAQRFNLKIGDSLDIQTQRGEFPLQIIGLINPKNVIAQQALSHVIITDIATAQELTGLYGKLSYIDVLSSDQVDTIKTRIGNSLPANVQLIAQETQSQAIRHMTEAFSINLTALSLLSLLVGMFLIYNTMTFLVIQRRKLIGSLRLIGVTRRQIFFLILKEACLLALIGTSAGIILGILLGQGLLQHVSTTINSFYFNVNANALFISPWQIGKAIILGMSATLLAVVAPAWEATRLSPVAILARSRLESGVRSLVVSAGLLGLVCIATGVGLALWSDVSIKLGLSSIFLLLIGFALLTPKVIIISMGWIERLLGKHMGILGKLPPRMVGAEISRTGIAIAALMIAVAATIGMDLMIGSFRQTVSQWLKITLQADFYVGLSNDKLTPDKAEADQRLKARIAKLPEVATLSSVLHTRVIGEHEPVDVSVFELTEQSKRGFILKLNKDEKTKVWSSFEQQSSVIITEAYAYHHRIQPGDVIRLQTGQGLHAFPVLAIYTDYSGDRGHIAMSRKQYLRFWPDLGYTGIGVYMRTNVDPNKLEKSILPLLAHNQTLRSNAEIYQASMQIFKQTFAITETLRWLAAGIAFVGVFGALMALQFERTQQLGILRAIGATPRQITLMITYETGLMGLVAGLLAIPTGFVVAYMLIFVVYQRSFGWTMAFHINPGVMIQGLLLALIAALLAGIIPARKMAQTLPAMALRSE